MKKALFALVVLAALSMTLIGCGGTGGAATIKVGVVAELTGEDQ